MSGGTHFRKGTFVLHTKKSYIGIVRFHLGDRIQVPFPVLDTKQIDKKEA